MNSRIRMKRHTVYKTGYPAECDPDDGAEDDAGEIW
jgi:hypothetical protein